MTKYDSNKLPSIQGKLRNRTAWRSDIAVKIKLGRNNL